MGQSGLCLGPAWYVCQIHSGVMESEVILVSINRDTIAHSYVRFRDTRYGLRAVMQ